MNVVVNSLYRKLEFALYGTVLAVSAGIGLLTERLDHRLQLQTLSSEVADFNHTFANALEAEISRLTAAANGMAALVALKPSIDQEEFEAAASRLGLDQTMVLNIALATDNVVQNVYPIERNHPLLGRDIRTIPNHAEGMELARRTGKPTLLGPLNLAQGGRGLILRLAFTSNFQGTDPSDRRQMISIVVDANVFFEEQSRKALNSRYLVNITRLEDGAEIYGDPSILVTSPITRTLTMSTGSWQIASVPSAGWPIISGNATTIAVLALVRFLIVCVVLRAIFKLVRRQKASEQQLTDAIESLEDGFALFDSSDRLQIANRRYFEIYRTSSDLLSPGTTFEEIIRGGVARGQYPDAIGQEQQWIDRRLSAHRAGGSVIEQRLDDGRWLRVVERKTRDGGTVGFRVDITELKLATEAANSAERAKSEFISVLSHELRTPLTIIMGYVSLLAQFGRLPDVQEVMKSRSFMANHREAAELQRLIDNVEDMASKAHRSTRQLLALIDQLLDFSKIEAGKLQLESETLEVRDVLEDIERSFRDTVESKGLDFSVSGVAARLNADPIRLRQILSNLVSNAVKFTEAGYVRVQAHIRDGMVLVEVQDSGCGIPEGMAEKVFGRFEQADSSSTRKAKGTGLGLAISKNLAEMMGGEIGYDSQVGVGSRFWFTVPMERPGSMQDHMSV